MASGAGAEAPGLKLGSEFAGHLIVAVLGEGGMGVVYRARKLALDRERALKVIAPALSKDPRFRERFKRESRMAAAIEHPNVIPVHDAGEEGGMLYLAMRLVEGSDLHRTAAGRGLDAERSARIIGGVAEGLDAAHAAGLVHRDVKPANVLIESRDSREHVYLTDFGITRTTTGGDTLTGTGEFIGSVEYIAPEQAAGEPVDARTDVYSLGGVAHFALTGHPPFPRDTQMATLFAHANAPRPRPAETDPSLPSDVDAVIAKAMAAIPEHRYPSTGQFAADLARALRVAPGPIAAGPPSAAAPGETEMRRAETRSLGRERGPSRRLLPAALGLAALAATALAVILATGGGDPEPETGRSRASPPVDAPKPKVLETIEVGSEPIGLSVGEEEKVWVAEPEAGRVEGIDTTIEQVVPPSADAPGAASVVVGFGSIWAVSPGEDALYRLDPAEGLPPKPIPVGDQPSDVAIDENGLWVSNEGSDDVMRVDPVTEVVDATEQVGAGAAPRSIATGGGSVWVGNIEGRNVVELDSRTGQRVGRAVAVGSRPSDLAYGEDGVWVTDFFDGTLARIDPRNREIRDDPIQVGDKPRGIKVGFGYVWVAHGGDGTVSVVDPAAEEVVAEVEVGKDPADIAVGEGSVWTADQADSTVTRIEP